MKIKTDVEFHKEVYRAYGHSGLVLDVLSFLEQGKILEARALMVIMLEHFRELNPTEVILKEEADVNRHNAIVDSIVQMETIYSKIMVLIEEYELLRQ